MYFKTNRKSDHEEKIADHENEVVAVFEGAKNFSKEDDDGESLCGCRCLGQPLDMLECQ